LKLTGNFDLLATLITSLALVCTSIPARSEEGGGHDGGTETTIEYVTISHPIEHEAFLQMKGYGLFAQSLKFLGKTMPNLARLLAEASNRKLWYHVPAEFDTLKTEQAKFHFMIKTPAYQNDHQIFISDLALEQMAEEDAARMFMQEAFEAMQTVRDSQAAVDVTGVIFKKHPSSKEIQDVALVSGFGVFLTQTQLAHAILALKLDYLQQILNSLDLRDDCSLYRDQKTARHNVPKNVLLRSLANFDTDSYPPFSAWDAPLAPDLVGLGASLPIYNTRLAKAALDTTSKQFGQDFAPRFNEAILWLRDENQDEHLEQKEVIFFTLDEIGETLYKRVNQETSELRKRLADEPAFIDILAMQLKTHNRQDRVGLRYMNSVYGLVEWAPTLERVHERIQNASWKNNSEMFEQLCKDSEILSPVVSGLKQSLEKEAKPDPLQPGDHEPSPLIVVPE
jgi:hypothetical protein